MNTISSISAVLRERQKASGVSQEALRESAGLSRQTMTNVMKGSQDYKLSTLLSVAQRLDMDVALVSQASGKVIRLSRSAAADGQALRKVAAHEGGMLTSTTPGATCPGKGSCPPERATACPHKSSSAGADEASSSKDDELEDRACPACGEDGGTRCGMPNCAY